MKLLSLDISGNHGREGMGTTGIALLQDGNPVSLSEKQAKFYASEVEYWASHEDLIMGYWPDHVVVEGYKLYNHKGMAAKTQANSDLQTPQLLGVIKLVCFRLGIPLTVQYASEVKTRWSEDVLVRLGILEERKGRYYWNGELTSSHKRDALKHGLHFTRYGVKKLAKS